MHSATESAAIEAGNLRLEFDRQMHSRVIARLGGKDIVMGPFNPSETISVAGAELADFALAGVKQERVNDSTGAGKQTTLTGTAGPLVKTVVITVRDRFPRMAFFQAHYKNL